MTVSKEQGQHEWNQLPEITFWATAITIAASDETALNTVLEQTAETVHHRLSGFRIYHEDGTIQHEVTRYPRYEYGIQTLEECRQEQQVLQDLLAHQGVQASVQEVPSGEVSKLPEDSDFRVLFGLRAGYDGHLFDTEEIKQALGSNVHVANLRAEIYSVGGGKPTYTEPVLILYGKKSALQAVARVADLYQQERFTVDNMKEGKSYTVETRHCKRSDFRFVPQKKLQM